MAAATTTYYSLLQWRMEAQRLKANTFFKSGDLPRAVELYLSASKLFDTYNAKTFNSEALLKDDCVGALAAAAGGAAGGASSSDAVPPAMATTASPATIRAALLEELIKSVGNACTSLYKLGRYEECAAVAKANGIEKNPYFAKGHAFVGMSNINLLATVLKGGEATIKGLSVAEKVFAAQRLHEAIQRLFTAMMLLPAMAAQVKVSLNEGLEYLKSLQKDSTVASALAAADADAETEGSSSSSAAAATVPFDSLIEVTRSTAGHGNGVVTKEALPTGTLIAQLSHPFSVAAYDGFHKQVCVACGVPILLTDALKEEDDNATTGNTAAQKKEKELGCDSCCYVRYCSESCQNRYHVPRHLLHECTFMNKLKVMNINIAERDLDVPDEFSELAIHTITTLSGLMVLKSSPLAFFDPTNKALADQMEQERVNGAAAADDNNMTETLITKAFKIRKSLLALEAHSVEVAQSMHPTLPLLCEVFSVNTMGDRGAVSSLASPPTSSTTNNNGLPQIDEHLVATLVGIVRCNAMEIADPSGLGVGQGLFAVPTAYLSLFPDGIKGMVLPSAAANCPPQAIPLSACHFNHSCDPNAAFDVRAQEIRTISPIPANSDVTISYIPQLYWPSILRTEGLAERFYFNCSCDRCSPYRRAAVAEERKKEAERKRAAAIAAGTATVGDGASALSDAMKLFTITTEDAVVSAIYDKISAAEKPIAASERPGATRYYYNNMLGVCGGIRQRPVEEIIGARTQTTTETEATDGTVTTTESATETPSNAAGVSSANNALCTEVLALAKQCSQHLEPWHYVLHDIHNTQTFLYSVLGDHGRALVSSMEELLTFEACVAAAVPAKVDKLRNIAACREGLKASYIVASGGNAANFTAEGFEKFVAETVFGCSPSAHKEVLAMLWSNNGAMLDLLLEVHATAPKQ